MPSNEARQSEERVAEIGAVVARQVDLDQLVRLASAVPPMARPDDSVPAPGTSADTDLRIGVAQDRAFGFYYADDLDALRAAGATLVRFDLDKSTLQFSDRASWFEDLGVSFHIGLYSYSLWLVGMTVIVMAAAIAYAVWAGRERPRAYFGLMLFLMAAVVAVFSSPFSFKIAAAPDPLAFCVKIAAAVAATAIVVSSLC